MSVTINKEFPIEVIERLFDKDQFYIKIFRELLEAVINDDFTKLSRTPTIIRDLYYNIRSKVSKFVEEQIYDNIFSSAAYTGLMNSLIDIYSVCYTVVDLRKNITNLEIQPDIVIDEFLTEFGFEGAHLFNYIQKREICRVVYWYLRRKGTPALIIKFLDMLGFGYFYVAEFELCKNFDETEEEDSSSLVLSNSSKLLYKSNLIYQEVPSKATAGFYDDATYTYTEMQNKDPFLIADCDELVSNENITFPAQSPYYQIGAAVTYTNLEKTISAFTYAMIKKTYQDINSGEDVFTSTVKEYNGKVSFLSLVLGYTYIFGEYFGVRDIFIYSPVEITEQMQQDIDEVREIIGLGVDNNELKEIHSSLAKLYDVTFLNMLYPNITDYSTLTENDNISHSYNYNDSDYPGTFEEDGYHHIEGDTGSLIESVAENSDDGLYRLSNKVFGWNKDTTDQSPLDIMYDIDSNISTLCSNLPWYPTTEDPLVPKSKNTVSYRKKQNLQKIEEIFYSPAIFSTYESAVESLIHHDIGFKKFLDDKMLTKEERDELLKTEDGIDEVKKNFDSILTLIDDILEAIEYYIFDNTTFMIPVKSLVMSYSRAEKIIKELDKYYAPYNAKLIDPFVVWLVRDLPGDLVAIEDFVKTENQSMYLRDVLWRADNYDKLDVAPPEPYAPISDFSSNGKVGDEYHVMPHIPTKLPEMRFEEGKYLLHLFDGTIETSDHAYFFPEHSEGVSYKDTPLYNTEEVISNNPLLYAVGYNWLYLRNENLIVNGRLYQSKYDWCPDKIKTELISKTASAINICKPDQKRLKELDNIRKDILESKSNISWFSVSLTSGGSVYTIPHNLDSYEVNVTVLDKTTYREIYPKVIRVDSNNVQLTFNEDLTNDCIVHILAKTDNDIKNNTTTQLYNIVGTGYVDQYIIPHNMNTRSVICEVYDRNSGLSIKNYSIRRMLNFICIKFDESPLPNAHLRIILYFYTPNNIKLRDPVDMLYSTETVLITNENKLYTYHHKFYNNNFIIKVYSKSTLEDVECKSIRKLNKSSIEFDFSNLNSNEEYCIFLIGCINRQINSLAIPLNNIIAYSETITGDGKTKIFDINHNLGTIDTFEQIFDIENITKTIQLTDTKSLRSSRTKSVVKACVDHVNEFNSRITFKNAPAIGKKYMISLFGPLTDNSSFIPSVYYNTYCKSFILVSSSKDGDPNVFPEFDSSEYVYPQYNDNTTDYIIQHNFNTESIVVQVYDQYGLKCDCITEILDPNTLSITLSNKIEDGSMYKVNILSIPNSFTSTKNISYSQYIRFNYVNTFIANIPADCISDTFSIVHNMKTEDVLVNVFNRITGESVETYVAVNDENCVTIGFKNILGSRNYIFDGGYSSTKIYDGILDGGFSYTVGQPITYNNIAKSIDDNYFAVIIGCKKSDHIVNNDERDEMSDILSPMPHFYHEFKILSDYDKTVHVSYDNDYFDSSREFVHDQIIKHRKYNIQKSDIPEIRERVDIYHFIRNNTSSIELTNTETFGFNVNDMTTNDFYGGAEVVGDVREPMLKLYTNNI